MNKLFAGLVVGALPLVFASCGGDNSGNTGTWQSGQTSAVLSAIGNSVSQVNQSKVTQYQTRAASRVSELDDPNGSVVNITANCTGGGTVSLTGSLNSAQTGVSPDTTTDMSYSYSLVFNQCGSTGSDGQNYILSGTGITVSGTSSWTTSGSVQDFQNYDVTTDDNLTISGNIDVSGGESISCDIQLSEQVATTGVNGTFTTSGSYNGTVCGQAEDGTISANVVVSSS